MQTPKRWQAIALVGFAWLVVFPLGAYGVYRLYDRPSLSKADQEDISRRLFKEYPMLPPDHPPIPEKKSKPRVDV
jgi:hypothetical protein